MTKIEERCNHCWHPWQGPVDHNNGRCEDNHNDDELHCHDKNGYCISGHDHNEIHCNECHDDADCRCFDPEG
jgi:hypothetical protein